MTHEDANLRQERLEEIRKELEFYDKRRAARQADLDHRAKRWRDRASDSGKSAVAFAQDVIRTGQILNGGGLLSIPAMVTLFGLDARTGLDGLMRTGTLFFSGLVCAWIASLLAFLAMDARAGAEWQWAIGEEEQTTYTHLRNPTDDWRCPQAAATDKKAQRLWSVFNWLRALAVFLIVLSLGCFTRGAYVGADMIIKAPARLGAASAPPPR